jgi:voltage-gated potassium channel
MKGYRHFSQRYKYFKTEAVDLGDRSRILFTRIEASPKKTIAVRLGLVVLLISLVVSIFWWDRSGLKDTVDSEISFRDIIYFTMVTITTVGYGDIVPVSDRARLIDSLFVTPIRIFIWFIFLGTAYEFVIQKMMEDYRMSQLAHQLVDHLVICGYGHSGSIAAKEMLAKGHPAKKIAIIDVSEGVLREAAEAGFIGLRGDATREDIIRKAQVEKAKAVVVSAGRDDTTVLIVLTVRHLNPHVRIIASVKEEENLKLVKQGGADVIVAPAKVGGYLLADAVERRYTADYLFDLMTAKGRVCLTERLAEPAEIDLTMSEVKDGLVVRVYREGEEIGFWETEHNRIQEGDLLLIIKPIGKNKPLSSPDIS